MPREPFRATSRRCRTAVIIGGVAAAALVGGCTRDRNEADRGLRQDKAHTVSDADAKRLKAGTSVSDADVKRLKAGTTLSAVEASLGQPAERDEDGSAPAAAAEQGPAARDVTLYYPRDQGSDEWALSFHYGNLVSKVRSNPRAPARGD